MIFFYDGEKNVYCIEDKTLRFALQPCKASARGTVENTEKCTKQFLVLKRCLATACNSVDHDETLSTKGYKLRKCNLTQQHT